MLGSGAVGQYALGQVTDLSASNATLIGVSGDGAVGTMTVTISGGATSITLAGVSGDGAIGTIVASVLSPELTGVYGSGAIGEIGINIGLPITQRLKLSNVLRRLRLLGNWTAGRARNMYVGRDFDPANATENEVYSLDFVNELGTGETLLSVSAVSFTVFQGTDANPDSHLSGNPSVTGSVVSQRLTTLTSGVTYTLAFTVLTSLSNTITLFSRVACRPVR